jgi:hypothetical protein
MKKMIGNGLASGFGSASSNALQIAAQKISGLLLNQRRECSFILNFRCTWTARDPLSPLLLSPLIF